MKYATIIILAGIVVAIYAVLGLVAVMAITSTAVIIVFYARILQTAPALPADDVARACEPNDMDDNHIDLYA